MKSVLGRGISVFGESSCFLFAHELSCHMKLLFCMYAGIHRKGVKRWFKSFAEPIALIAPINVLELVIKPLSLCMRLFGNVLGAFVIMELIEYIVPVGVPIVFSMYFDIFDGLIQAYVFVFLTGLFMKEAME